MATQDPPYVVLLGEVGSGKSTIVEKLTGETERSSDDQESKTRCSEPFWSQCGQLIISDTPGNNASSDQFEHNMWIATAFNFMLVSKIFIVVKADTGRIDGIVSKIVQFSERFLDLDEDPLGVIVTNMDKVEISEEDIRSKIEEKCDIKDILFSSKDTPGDSLIKGILQVSKTPKKHDFSINHENFLRIFQKLHKNSPREILVFIKREVNGFIQKQADFNKQRDAYPKKDQVDLVFEFQAVMRQEITEIQKKMQLDFNLTFDGDKKYDEVAFTQNLTNQLISTLHKIRIEARGFQSDHDNNFRKCPHCNAVWTKVEGCVDETQCGSRPRSSNDLRAPNFAEMGTFTFQWKPTEKTWDIIHKGSKSVQHHTKNTELNAGCGKSIIWREMAQVNIPEEFSSGIVKMSDVAVLPDGPPAQQFNDGLDETLASFKKKMVLSPPKQTNAQPQKCLVCQKSPVNTTLLDCGHSCTCLDCARLLQNMAKPCPFCKGPISGSNMKIYPTL